MKKKVVNSLFRNFIPLLPLLLLDVKVLTPSDSKPETWQLAKAEMEMSNDIFCQSRLHTGGVHFVSTVYCLVYQRHLSTKHPLYEFFKYHCEGTVAQISMAWKGLDVLGDLYAIGIEQYLGFASKAYDERNYDHTTYEHFIDVS